MYAALVPWIERVSQTANLCLSVIHLQEFAAWEDLSMAHGIATWLDGLDVVWMHSSELVRMNEIDHWLAAAVGLNNAGPAPVWAPSLVSTMNTLNVESSVGALQLGTIPGFVSALRIRGPDSDRRQALAHVEQFREGRLWAAQALSPEQRAGELNRLWNAALRQEASEAHYRLRHQEGAYGKLRLDRNVVDTFVDFVANTPLAVPSLRVSHAYVERRPLRGGGVDRGVISGASPGRA